MAWIKLEHVSGFDIINLDKVYRILETSPVEITFYDSNSFLPISYTFSTTANKKHFYNNLIKVINAIDVSQLARQ
jgi:hypothetical protein